MPIVLGLLFLLFGSAYARNTGTFRAPDERMHYYYLQQLSVGRLPHVTPERSTWESHQPPLYYISAWPVFWISRSWGEPAQVLIIRHWSLLMGLMTIIVTWWWTRRLFPNQFFVPVVATGFVALNPQFIYMNSAINNDSLTNLLGAVIMLSVVDLWLRRPTRRTLMTVSLLAAAAWLTKPALWPMAILLVVVALGRDRRSRTWFAVLPLIAAAVWWSARNIHLYGDLLASRYLRDLWYAEQHKDWLNLKGIRHWAKDFFESFWARFGYFTLALRRINYQILRVIGLFLAGGFIWWVWRESPKLEPVRRRLLLVLGACIAMLGLGIVVYNLSFYQPQGRYLFPVIGGLGVAAALGLERLSPKKVRPIVAVLFLLWLVWLDWQGLKIIRRYG